VPSRAVSAKAPGKGAFALGERNSSGAIRTAEPAGMQGHPEVGHPLVEMAAVGLVPLLPPNQPPEKRERRIQDEIGERQHEPHRSRGTPITISVRPAMCRSSKPASCATGSRRARCFRVVDESNTK
jgi:hypothetical protein